MQAFVQLHPILKKGIDVGLKEWFFTNIRKKILSSKNRRHLWLLNHTNLLPEP